MTFPMTFPMGFFELRWRRLVDLPPPHRNEDPAVGQMYQSMLEGRPARHALFEAIEYFDTDVWTVGTTTSP